MKQLILVAALVAACGAPGGPDGLAGPGATPGPPGPEGPSPAPQGPQAAVLVTTHGDSVYVPAYVSIPVGGSAYHQARVVLGGTSPNMAVVIGQAEPWCGGAAEVVGILTNLEKHRGLRLADSFTAWYEGACALNAMILEAPGAYDLWTVVDGHQVGSSAMRWQYDYLDVPSCVVADGNFCGDFFVELEVLP